MKFLPAAVVTTLLLVAGAVDARDYIVSSTRSNVADVQVQIHCEHDGPTSGVVPQGEVFVDGERRSPDIVGDDPYYDRHADPDAGSPDFGCDAIRILQNRNVPRMFRAVIETARDPEGVVADPVGALMPLLPLP